MKYDLVGIDRYNIRTIVGRLQLKFDCIENINSNFPSNKLEFLFIYG